MFGPLETEDTGRESDIPSASLGLGISRGCAGFGWCRVNFPHSSQSGPVVWICVEMVLIIKWCFHYYWAELTQSHGLSCSSPCSTSQGVGGTTGDGRDTAGPADPTDPRDIPAHTGSCAVHKSWEKRKKGEGRKWGRGAVLHMVFAFPSRCYNLMEPHFPGDGRTPAAHGKWVMIYLFCFACAQLLLCLLNCLYLKPRVFSLLPLKFSPPPQCWGTWVCSFVGLGWLGLNHNRAKRSFAIGTFRNNPKTYHMSISLQNSHKYFSRTGGVGDPWYLFMELINCQKAFFFFPFSRN